MTIPPLPHLLVLLRTPALPAAAELREALLEAGMAVHALNPLPGEDAGFAITWLTEDGPEGARVQLRIGAPSMLALKAPGAVPEDEVDAAVEGMMALIEPVIIAFLGVVIGTIVVAMYLPMFSLISQIG